MITIQSLKENAGPISAGVAIVIALALAAHVLLPKLQTGMFEQVVSPLPLRESAGTSSLRTLITQLRIFAATPGAVSTTVSVPGLANPGSTTSVTLVRKGDGTEVTGVSDALCSFILERQAVFASRGKSAPATCTWGGAGLGIHIVFVENKLLGATK